MKFEKEDESLKNSQRQLKFNYDGTISLPENIKKDLSFRKEKKLDIFDDYGQDDEVHNLDDNVEGFNLYDGEKKLSPLVFSNNKSQED
ncbi:hypothetical protein COX97_04265, partial [Candidatus Pacearchaeota archaeon CG_4_10_14_0_2_um_filter_05_32_18]